MERFKERPWLAAALVLLMAMAIAAFGFFRGGGVDYDGAVYLERGLYHAEQIEAKGNLYALRLPWSLQFEVPKPPLYHGLIAALALAAGRDEIGLILFLALFLPLAALFVGTWALAREAAPKGGLLAPVILAAMPAVLATGARVLVEIALAACVTAAALFAHRLMGSACRMRDALGLGLALGLAALTKLTGILFGGVLLVTLVIWTWRRDKGEWRGGWLALATLVAALLAAPWYLRNGLAAYEFGRFSADSWAHWDAGSPVTRPVRLLLASLGGPLAALLALGLFTAWRSASRTKGDRALGALAGSVGIVSAAMVVSARNFDPRFWVPSLGLIAAWLAGRLASWASTSRRCWAVAAGLVVAVFLCVWGAANIRPSTTPWQLSDLLEQRADDLPGGSRICNLGESYDWNRYQIRLMVQISNLRPRPVVVDLQHEVAVADLPEAVGRCDLLFILGPEELSRERSQIRQNAHLEELRPIVVRVAEETLERDRLAGAVLDSETRVEVWRRKF